MNVVLYGLGSGVKQVKSVLKDEHRIIAYTDSFSCIKDYMEVPFVKPSDIKKLDYDFVVITIRDRKSAYSIYEWLVREYGLEEEKVIPYFCYVDIELYKAKLLQQKEEIEGLIIGNSMSQYGIVEDVFPVPFLNLSCRSQDIYTSSYVLEKIVTEYPQKIKKLKYLIFDLYDYNGFNIDTSMSTGYLDYISCGGIYREHNFDKNSHYKSKLSEELFMNKYMIRGKKIRGKGYKELFIEHSLLSSENKNDDKFAHIDEQAPLTPRKFIGANVKRRFEITIKENMASLENIVKKLKSYKPDLEIIFTLIPRFITMEEVSVPFMKDWKAEFENIMKYFESIYGIRFYDYKRCTEISGNCHFYADVDHLNTVGGRCMSTLVMKELLD